MVTQYLYTIPILFVTIICMLYLTVINEHILNVHKKAFIVAFLGVIFVTVCEVLTILLNGAALPWRFFHFLSNYFGFALTPILIAFFAVSIGRFHHLKIAAAGVSAYFILYNVLVITKQLFFIDAQNNYHRGNLFPIYIVAYFLAVLYLLCETLQYSQKGFLQHKMFAYLLSFCFLFSSSIQVLNPKVYTTRITVILCLCIYYAYNIELTNLLDKLTGVLNQGTYLRKIKELKEEQTVIILDIDDFKMINDSFGHQYGNKCLIMIAQAIRATFGNFGQCYRIGGDEFAIILRKCHNVDRLITRLEKAVADKFRNAPHPFSVSIGYARFEKNDSVDAVIQRADLNMYVVKNQKKMLKNNGY